ncbi:MAG: PH domain-containing protein [Streptosporangiales bacterium]|nr:PH domain-containing protein [Streptosporangiales bacterium]
MGLALVTAMVAGIAWLVDAAAPSWLPRLVVEHPWWGPLLVALLGLPEVLLAPTWRYLVHRWEVTQEVVYIRTGWFDREWRLVPISRIQTVDTTRGVLERFLGLATLQIRTASHAGSSEIEGLPAEVAAGLAHDLARQAGVLRDDAT